MYFVWAERNEFGLWAKIVKPIFGLHSVGPYSGYIVCRLEIILNVCRVANTGLMVHFPTYAGISSQEAEPAWWCLMFGFAMAMSLYGCTPHWMLKMHGMLVIDFDHCI